MQSRSSSGNFIPVRFCLASKGWIPFTHWTLRRLTYACPYSPGLRSARPRQRSSCTPCSICAATSHPLRRVKFNDPETGKSPVFLTNNIALPALTIARLYKYRWQVELFFKWIKQHPRIKAFFGTSEKAVKAQIWSAICVYVLVAIVKKRLGIKASLYEMLQILGLTLFEKSQLLQLFTCAPSKISPTCAPNQLNLFD